MTDYTELKRLAEAATPGPWTADNSHHEGSINSADRHIGMVSMYARRPNDITQNFSNQAFIAAANPAAVLHLLAEVRGLSEGASMRAINSLRTDFRTVQAERNRLDEAFKNFHRSLCERFGYYHDEIDWQRDQVSLEEHIATQFSHVNAENAALRGQVQALQRGAGQFQEQNDALLEGMTRIMQSTRLGDPAFAIACEVVGDLEHSANSRAGGEGTESSLSLSLRLPKGSRAHEAGEQILCNEKSMNKGVDHG